MLKVSFKVIERGRWAYILWPWSDPAEFLYDSLGSGLGARYHLAQPIKLSREAWLEIVPQGGYHGEYHHDLLFGCTAWGYHVYRRFPSAGSHYLTQHGLDGISKYWWDQAYEIASGEPVGVVEFSFRIESKSGLFTMTNLDWIQHFVSGRNGRLSTTGITINKGGRHEHSSSKSAL